MTTRQYGRTIPKTYIYNRKKYELFGHYPTESQALKSASSYREDYGLNARVVKRSYPRTKEQWVYAVYCRGTVDGKTYGN
jgi:hypothetical protein